ncbi:hypothetical protein COU20_02285 [Candidatus Kaiserbacteria bacterium CG10_big_fil_rev_8_21_14_0_10_59_10]|uniref:UDP-N-acetylglucosamine 2-epimerase domain-containing protein n=1 Tax=Candidatus Kaiserbacteria bacterium CG10_big_fil_rev_8_21_14_0_10_59_10 TaxID=1974612 RepID=A0A2H0U7Q6_9BACT|nr:MAG: hypothetical protein COU20_02285 [Candidatus Kaiserbacteria bacterium CG10_big_fil_rev_8_21_14_0_10_59_10]
MFDCVRDELKRRGHSCCVLILREPSEEYFRRVSDFNGADVQIDGFVNGGWHARAVRAGRYIPFFGTLISAWVSYRYVKAYLKRSGAEVFVVTDDRALFYPLAALRAASKLTIPAILLPVETLMRLDALKEDKSSIVPHLTAFRRLARLIIHRMYSANVRMNDGKEAHFYQPRALLPFVLFWRTLLPKNPWVRGSNSAIAKILVNSNAQFEENAVQGLERRCMEVVGFPPHDIVARICRDRSGTKRAFEREFNASAENIFLVLGTHFRGTYDPAEFPAIREELRSVFGIIETFVPDNHTLAIKLHPGIPEGEWNEYLRVLKTRNVVLVHTQWDAYRLTAIADAVCMFTSSLVMAALATDAPVIAYKLRLRSFDEFYQPYASVRRARTLPELEAQLARGFVLSGEEREARRDDRARLGMFDGRSTERTANAIEKLGKMG